MSISRSRRSRVFTISFPENLARQVDQVARLESRNISELFREAFRFYCLEGMHRRLERVRGAARLRDPQPRYTESDVEGLVDEIRSAGSSRKKRK
jgi:metal-responsive CopG/Arc/MetJ family transcriptional regulator